MKKLLFFILITILLAIPAFAASRWLPTAYSGDQLIATGQTVIVDANIYWTGLTVGDKLQLKNSLTSTGTVFYTFVAPTANGSYHVPANQRNMVVDTGVYLDATISGGILGIELITQ